MRKFNNFSVFQLTHYCLKSLRKVILTFGLFTLSQLIFAEELSVVSSGGFAQAFVQLSVPFSKSYPDIKIELQRGPSMGETANAIPKRLARGEMVDVVIMADDMLDQLMTEGKLLPGSKVVLARSLIAAAVKAGAPKPDISSKEALVKTLLAAKSIAYSDSASGEYLSNELFPRLGVSEQLKLKAKKIHAIPVGEVVASGQAEIGFQQYSELLPVQGIEILGKLSSDVQKETFFSAAIVSNSKHVESAKALLKFLSSAQAQTIVKQTGLDSVLDK